MYKWAPYSKLYVRLEQHMSLDIGGHCQQSIKVFFNKVYSIECKKTAAVDFEKNFVDSEGPPEVDYCATVRLRQCDNPAFMKQMDILLVVFLEESIRTEQPPLSPAVSP